MWQLTQPAVAFTGQIDRSDTVFAVGGDTGDLAAPESRTWHVKHRAS